MGIGLIEPQTSVNLKTKVDAQALQKNRENAARRQFEAIKREIAQMSYERDVMREALSEIVKLQRKDSQDFELEIKRIAAVAITQIEIAERNRT
jgi:vesicle coat complex subunit